MKSTESIISPKGAKNTLSKFVPLAILVVILLTALGAVFALKDKVSGFGNVDESKTQAVYLKGGQIFFGDITGFNHDHLTLEGIYYLQVGDSQEAASQEDAAKEQSSAISLTKRGCEIFAPEDKMFISRDEVAYFENLRTDGDVAKGIQTWVNDNPNGLDCGGSDS